MSILFASDNFDVNYGTGSLVRGSGDLEPPFADGSGSGAVLGSLLNESAAGNTTAMPAPVFLYNNWAIPVGIAIALLIIVTIGGNTLVIMSILIVKRLRTPYNFLIVSLATTDLGIAAIVMPLAALSELYGAWPLSSIACDIFVCLDMLFCTASILNLAAISLDRFLVITKPFQYGQRRTPKFMLLLVFISWAFAACVSLPAVVGWREERQPGVCSYPSDLGFQLYATLVAFFVPTGVIIYVTFRIFFIVSRMARADRETNRSKPHEQVALVPHPPAPAVGQSKELGLGLTKGSQNKEGSTAANASADTSNGLANKEKTATISATAFRSRISKMLRPFGSGSSGSSENRELKAVNTLGVFLGTFLLCWLPFFTMQLVNALRRCGSPPECVHMTLFGFLLWLGYLKSMCNPIINALYNRDIRRPFVEILRCRCRTLNSTLRNEAYADMYGRGSIAKPGAGGQDHLVKKSRSLSDAASTSAAADVVRDVS